MTACYIFNGNDKWLLSTGWLPAKLIGNCLLLEVEVLPGLEVCCWIGEGLSCRMGRGRNVGAVCPSVPLDRFLLEKRPLREPWLEICQSHVNNSWFWLLWSETLPVQHRLVFWQLLTFLVMCSLSAQWVFSDWNTSWLSALGDLEYVSLQNPFVPFPRCLQQGM